MKLLAAKEKMITPNGLRTNRGDSRLPNYLLENSRYGLIRQGFALQKADFDVIATDQNGRFEFNSVLSNSEFTIYSKLVNDDEIGMFEIEAFDSSKSETTKDLGVFKVDQAAICTIKGRLVLTDGKPLPSGMRMLASRENAWDSQNVDITEDGTFEIRGLAPNEDYSFSVRLKGYRLSTKHNKLQQTQAWQLSKYVEGDVKMLEVFMVPEPKIDSAK